MDDASIKVVDLIFGRWRSQILYAGVKLGVFDALSSGAKSAVSVADELDVDAVMLYQTNITYHLKGLYAPYRPMWLLAAH